MRSVCIPVALIFASVLAYSQDAQLREQAEKLMERANAASAPADLPNLERTDTFRVFGDGGVREGSFSRVVIQGTGRRDEFEFGDYHAVKVSTREGVAFDNASLITPPEIRTLMQITPIFRGGFDETDVVRRIADRQVNGRAARCVEFDTVAGEKTDNNELCVDASNGTLLLLRVGKELIENSDFFPFAGALMPAKVTYSYAGVRKIEITQAMTALSADTANVLAAPPNATLYHYCTTYRRPFGVSMPQPKPGTAGTSTDIVVRGFIEPDGKVHEAVVQSSDRPELNAEALALIQQWTFTPALCNGKPNRAEASFALHFEAR